MFFNSNKKHGNCAYKKIDLRVRDELETLFLSNSVRGYLKILEINDEFTSLV